MESFFVSQVSVGVVEFTSEFVVRTGLGPTELRGAFNGGGGKQFIECDMTKGISGITFVNISSLSHLCFFCALNSVLLCLRYYE